MKDHGLQMYPECRECQCMVLSMQDVLWDVRSGDDSVDMEYARLMLASSSTLPRARVEHSTTCE